jgi:mannose-1-phosphate guanylyltransferase
MMTGEERPKQFCRLLGSDTLLTETRHRVCLNVEASRTLYVVTRAHDVFYGPELRDVPRWQIVEQPSNRGTTAAVAAAVMRLRAIGADGVVGFFPADHHYRDVAALQRTVSQGYAIAAANPHAAVLIGAEADRPETEYGWIEPGCPLQAEGIRMARATLVRSVRQFCEKPTPEVARDLLARRCLWNTMVVMARIHVFEELLAAAVPDVWELFAALYGARTPLEETRLAEDLYGRIVSSDFSRDVLSVQADRLTVITLPSAGWTDLGQASRVLDVLNVHRPHAADRLAVS